MAKIKLSNKTTNKMSINLLDDSMHLNPHQTYTLLREKHPVYKVQPNNTWAISDHKLILFALSHPEIFSSLNTNDIFQPHKQQSGNLKSYPIAFEDKPEHTLHRSLITRSFTKNSINNFSSTIYTITQALAQNIAKQKNFEFMDTFAYPLIDKIFSKFIGIDDIYLQNLCRQWILMIEKSVSLNKNNVDSIYNQLSSGFEKLIKKAQNIPRNTIVGAIANNCLSDTHLTLTIRKNILELLVLAGTQLTPHLLAQSVIQLIHDKKTYNALINNKKLINNFVDELLRLYSPIHLVARRTLLPIKLRGIDIQAGESILLLLSAANRDPNIFHEPDKFHMLRKNLSSHVAFSRGIHFCLGYLYAKKQLSIAIEILLPMVPKMSAPKRGSLNWNYSLLAHCFNKLPIKITEYSK